MTRIFEALGKNHRGYWTMFWGSLLSWKKKIKQFPGCSRESVGGSEKLWWMEGVGGWWSQTLLRFYTVWQVKFQKCVNDCSDVWSSFLYIPSSYQYIQHIECRVWNWMEYFLLCLCFVCERIVYCLEHDYLYLVLASSFCSWRSTLGHQYSILKEGKMK